MIPDINIKISKFTLLPFLLVVEDCVLKLTLSTMVENLFCIKPTTRSAHVVLQINLYFIQV